MDFDEYEENFPFSGNTVMINCECGKEYSVDTHHKYCFICGLNLKTQIVAILKKRNDEITEYRKKVDTDLPNFRTGLLKKHGYSIEGVVAFRVCDLFNYVRTKTSRRRIEDSAKMFEEMIALKV